MTLKVALAQVAPVWLNRAATLEKILANVEQAAEQEAGLVVFGEALLPGYPFWPELTDGARFESPGQKELFAHYAEQAVDLDRGQLDRLCRLAGDLGVAIYLGFIERSAQRVYRSAGQHRFGASQTGADLRGAPGLVARRRPWSAGA
jgi:nitrilase